MRFHDPAFAAEYDRRLANEGYPGVLLDAVERAIGGCERVLDVGAGSGFFSLPLARLGHRVTAIDPAAPMLALLRAKLDASTGETIVLDNRAWDEWEGDAADACICVHALYPMRDPAAALVKMKRQARVCVLVVRSVRELPTLSNEIRRRFDRIREQQNYERLAADTFQKNGIPYRVRTVLQTRTSVFHDPDEEARYYSLHLGIDPGEAGRVREILLSLATCAGGVYSYNAKYEDRIILF